MKAFWPAVNGRYSIFLFSLLAATVVWTLVRWMAAPVIEQLNERSADLVWRLSADRHDERRLIIVDIDERSLQEVGPWPWPRALQARLMQKLSTLGAGQQIYDVVFTAPSGEGDAALSEAVARHQPVLAQVFALEQGGQAASGELGGSLGWLTCPAPFADATGYLANTPVVVGEHPINLGHITPRIAADGVVRQQPAVICFKDKSYPALALAAMLRSGSGRELSLERGNRWLESPWYLTGPGLPAGTLPLDERGDIRVSWRQHPDSFISLSAADVLAGRVPEGLLSGAWVLVGSSAFGLNDSIATPFGGADAGLQVHAQIITALIDGRTPYTPRAASALQILAAALGAGLLLLLSKVRSQSGASLPRFPEYLLSIAALGWAGFLWLIHALLLLHSSIWAGWAEPALWALLLGIAMGIFTHAKSRFDRDRLYAHLSSYLPAPVAASLALQPPSGAIKASTNMVSVLFADIRNFSAYCEARPPEEAAAVLHAFFSTATKVIEAHGGVVEAFQGDAIIAVWNGEPDTHFRSAGSAAAHLHSDHAHRALKAAIKLHAAMDGVLPDPAPAGLEPLALGIGVESGPAMAGSFGLASRRTHMVMGRTVTIAGRLVDMTAELAHPILVGEGLAAQVGASGLESLGTFLLDGMRVPHHVYAHPLHLVYPAR